MTAYSSIISEFANAEDQTAYETWLADKVAASLADSRPPTSHDEVIGDMRVIIERSRQPPAAC